MIHNILFFAAFVGLAYIAGCLITPDPSAARLRVRVNRNEEDSR